jgi:hypothetical protein
MIILLIWAPLAAADEESFCYVTAYSYNMKAAYHTPIFKQMSRGKSFNEEQYVADMKQIRNLEDAFQTHLKRKHKINSSFFVFSAATGFKSHSFAERRLNLELVDHRTKGLKIEVVNDFKAD